MKLSYSLEILPSTKTLEASETFRYYLIIEGRGKCQSRHKEISFREQDVLAIPVNQEIWFSCDSSVVAGSIRAEDMRTPRPEIYHLSGEHTGLLRQLFYIALDIHKIELPYYETVRNSMDQLVFSALIASELASNTLNSTVVSIVQMINDHFTDPDFDLHEIIVNTGYSVNHFRKLFRDEVGMPPLEFMNNRRLEYAKDLFWQWKDQLTIAQIAHTCGFRDEYYFSRYFKKREGVTPGQYLQQIQG